MHGLLAIAPITQPGFFVPAIMIVVCAAGWAIRLHWQIQAMRATLSVVDKDCTKLVVMHENADDHGFGTVALRRLQELESARIGQLIQNNTRVMSELVHYVKYHTEAVTGTKPPPPIPEVAQGDHG